MLTLLATQCSLHFDKHKKKFIAYIYTRFYQILKKNKKALKLKQSNILHHRTAPTSNQIVESDGYFDVNDVAWLDVFIGM